MARTGGVRVRAAARPLVVTLSAFVALMSRSSWLRSRAGWILAVGVLTAMVASCSGESAGQQPTALGVRVAAPGPPAARAVSDVNGDGLADLVVPGRAERLPDGDTIQHSVVVVFGSRAPGPVDVRGLAPGQGFSIRSARDVGTEGQIGDVDGDGLSDIRLAAYDRSGQTTRDYIVYGRRETADVQLDRGGPRVQPIPAPGEQFSWPLGDLNGDGASELAFIRAGRVIVVYGRRDRAPITRALLRAPGGGGW